MNMNVPFQRIKNTAGIRNYFSHSKALLLVCVLFFSQLTSAQQAVSTTVKLAPAATPTITIGTWAKVATKAPHANCGVMLLLTDGTVVAHNTSGTGEGTGWDRLTPSATGSYVNGTWTSITSMKYDRLFFSSQVLPNGELFAAGGEYGAGDTAGEVYNPVTNVWNRTEGVVSKMNIFDGNSELLYNGIVLVGLQSGSNPSYDDQFYSVTTNKWTTAPLASLDHDEAQWLKLPDSSILFVGIGGTAACRYEPKTNTFIADNPTPVELYDALGSEAGSAVLLPNGKAIFFGATGHNCIYTPSGGTAKGTWVAAPDFPTIGGSLTSMDDAPSAMMVNGHILIGVGPAPTSTVEFQDPLYFVEYDYVSNTFAQVTSVLPGGTDEISTAASYQCNMLDLPDGTVLMSVDQQSTAVSEQYYVYTPGSAAIASGKPVINSIIPDACPYYKLTGKLFNGISEGAQYGDDAQMSTNYPLVRLTNSSGDVYYCKTTLWNRIGAVMTDSLKDTTVFETPTGLPAGTYSLVVIANGFASSPTIFTTLQATASVNSEANCGNANGSASASVSGGLTSYTYSWTGGGGSSATATGLAAGTYTVTVTDLDGCTQSASITITQSSSLSTSASISANVKCNGQTDGSATAAVSGGATPYTYAWTGGKTTATITGLAAGTYTVSISDHSGCSGTASVTVTQPTTISATATVGAEASCSGSTGSASSTVSGGTSPYTYAWTGGKTTPTITGLSAGTYNLDVTDNNGCTQSASVTITQSTSLASVSASINGNVKCNGESDGSATASTSSGTSPYTYSWTGGGGNSATATGLAANTYTVTITDHAGCSGTASVTITQPTLLHATGNETANTTCGDANGSASSTVNGGLSPYTYAWTGGAATSTINGLSAGTYILTVTDNNGCTQTSSVTINSSTTVSALANTTVNVTCNGLADGSASSTVSGGTSPYTYAWTGGATTPTINGLSAGTYIVDVTDKNGCTGTASTTISQPASMDVTSAFTTSSSGACNGTASVTLVSGGTAPYTYSWNNSTSSTTATINNQCPGSYCCVITDNNGCSQSTCVDITTGIESISNASSIDIYPDPSNGSFTVAGLIQGQVVELYNALGQELNSIKADQTTMYFNISTQADGIYLVRILNRDGSLVTQKKLVKAQ
jgi:hypothetical protein